MFLNLRYINQINAQHSYILTAHTQISFKNLHVIFQKVSADDCFAQQNRHIYIKLKK